MIKVLFSALLLLVAACTVSPPVKTKNLLTCDLSDYTPKAPPLIRTASQLAKFSIDLELSREKLMVARNDCNNKLMKVQKDK